MRADGWFFDTELLYRIRRRGVSWTEIPVPLLDRGVRRQLGWAADIPLAIARAVHLRGEGADRPEDRAALSGGEGRTRP